jgi:hypothetical protein
MKKIYYLILLIALGLVLSGCDNNRRITIKIDDKEEKITSKFLIGLDQETFDDKYKYQPVSLISNIKEIKKGKCYGNYGEDVEARIMVGNEGNECYDLVLDNNVILSVNTTYINVNNLHNDTSIKVDSNILKRDDKNIYMVGIKKDNNSIYISYNLNKIEVNK